MIRGSDMVTEICQFITQMTKPPHVYYELHVTGNALSPPEILYSRVIAPIIWKVLNPALLMSKQHITSRALPLTTLKSILFGLVREIVSEGIDCKV